MKKSQDKTEQKCFILLADRREQNNSQTDFVDHIVSS